MKARALSFFAAASALAFLAGCQRPFTRDNFDMIQVGVDDREDVRHILGKPTAELSDKWLYDDLKRHYSAQIHFDQNGQVSGKEWMDAKTGKWEGRNPDAEEPPQGEVRETHEKTTRIDKD